MKAIVWLGVHHSATRNTTRARTIERWHRARGFRAIGYNIVIEADGKRVQGRHIRERLAAHPPRNGDSLAVCVAGDMTRADDPRYAWTDSQIVSLIEWVQAARILVPKLRLAGHKDIGSTPTLCPGVDLDELKAIVGWEVDDVTY